MNNDETYTPCTQCGRPMAYCKGQCCGKPKGCQCREYGPSVCGAIRQRQPECPHAAVIPSVVVEHADSLKDLCDTFVHVSDINTTFYIDDKHRPIITWAGPVEYDNYDLATNSLDLRSQFLIDFANNRGAYYNKTGNYKIFNFGESGTAGGVAIVVAGENYVGSFTGATFAELSAAVRNGASIYVSGAETHMGGEVPITTSFGMYATNAYIVTAEENEETYDVVYIEGYEERGLLSVRIAAFSDGSVTFSYSNMLNQGIADVRYTPYIDSWKITNPVFYRGRSYSASPSDSLYCVSYDSGMNADWGIKNASDFSLQSGMRCSIMVNGPTSSSSTFYDYEFGFSVQTSSGTYIRKPIYRQLPYLSSPSGAQPLYYKDIPYIINSGIILDLVYINNGVYDGWIVTNL